LFSYLLLTVTVRVVSFEI